MQMRIAWAPWKPNSHFGKHFNIVKNLVDNISKHHFTEWINQYKHLTQLEWQSFLHTDHWCQKQQHINNDSQDFPSCFDYEFDYQPKYATTTFIETLVVVKYSPYSH